MFYHVCTHSFENEEIPCICHEVKTGCCYGCFQEFVEPERAWTLKHFYYMKYKQKNVQCSISIQRCVCV